MKPKEITRVQAYKLYPTGSWNCAHDFTNGWNACIEAHKQHRALKKAKRVKVSRVDEGNCSMSEIYKLHEHMEGIVNRYTTISDWQIQMRERFEKNETYNIDAEIKEIHAVVQALYAIGGEDATRLDKLETQIRVIHAGDTDIQKRMLKSIYDLNEKVLKLEE